MEPFTEPSPPPFAAPVTTPATLPSPPDASDEPAPFAEPPPFAPFASRVPVPGQLTAQWTQVFWIGWLLVAGSFAAIWYSSRLVGLSTWWLGPSTEPRFFLLNVLPFVAPLGLCAAGLTRVRWLPWWGIGGALVTAGIAALDISRVPGYAVIEFALAGAGLLVSVACFGGMYRRADADSPHRS